MNAQVDEIKLNNKCSTDEEYTSCKSATTSTLVSTTSSPASQGGDAYMCRLDTMQILFRTTDKAILVDSVTKQETETKLDATVSDHGESENYL